MADFFIKRPVFAIVLSLLITLAGLVAMRALPIWPIRPRWNWRWRRAARWPMRWGLSTPHRWAR